VVWALTWEEALDRGLRALDDMRVQGVKTTAAYYQEILRNPEFRSGQFDTSFVDSHPELTRLLDQAPRRTWPWPSPPRSPPMPACEAES
jgi:pyruvate carboxylase